MSPFLWRLRALLAPGKCLMGVGGSGYCHCRRNYYHRHEQGDVGGCAGRQTAWSDGDADGDLWPQAAGCSREGKQGVRAPGSLPAWACALHCQELVSCDLGQVTSPVRAPFSSIKGDNDCAYVSRLLCQPRKKSPERRLRRKVGPCGFASGPAAEEAQCVGAELPRAWDAATVVVAWACWVETFRSGLCRPLWGEGRREPRKSAGCPASLPSSLATFSEAPMKHASPPPLLLLVRVGAWAPLCLTAAHVVQGHNQRDPIRGCPPPSRTPTVCLPCWDHCSTRGEAGERIPATA